MKKGSKPGIIIILLLLIMAALTMLSYVGIKKKCEEFTRDRELAKNDLDAAKNRRISLVAELQMLTSEERIAGIAINELGMKKRTEPVIEFKADIEKIERISRILKEKYD
jgi:cell division protein FtsL